MDLKERIKELCKKNNISMNQLEQELDFGKGYISKLGKSTPNATKIQQLANRLGVSVDYLMTGKNDEEPTASLSPFETLAAHFEGEELSEEELSEIMKYVEFVKSRRSK